MIEQQLRQQLLHYAQQLSSSGLSVGKSGNISVRCEEGFLITPSGIDYQTLETADMVKMTVDGGCIDSNGLKPSSEWHFHAALYKSKHRQQAIVHAHPSHSTALACTQRNIPAFHYMVAIAGGYQIPLVPYALFGTEQLAKNITSGIGAHQACLLESHGMIAMANNLPQAFNLAIEVENLAQQYLLALTIGNIKLLSNTEMDDALKQFEDYGNRA